VRDLPRASGSSASQDVPARGATGSSVDIAAVGPEPTFATTTGPNTADEQTNFAGVARSDLEPPDPWLAVGPDHVLQAVNTTMRLTDREGTLQGSVELLDFFDIASLGSDAIAFDPRVIYDSLHGRWIAITAHYDCDTNFADVGTGFIDMAISSTTDPMGSWEVFYLEFPDLVPDYPGIGTSTDKVVLSSNVFALEPDEDADLGCSPTGLVTTELDIFAWSQLIGTGDVDVDFFFGGSGYPNSFVTWRPAVQTPATSATVFLVTEKVTAANGVAYAKITGSPASGTTAISAPADLSAANIIGGFETPPPPEQPGTGGPGSPTTIVDAVDERPTDAIWQDNRLAFVSTYPCDPAGGATEDRDCVRISELSTTTATPSKLQDFLIGEEAADHYMGGIGYAGNGDLHAVWTRSSATASNYPSSYSAVQLLSDDANEISDKQLLAAGTGVYDGTRWGDYIGVAQDPQVPNAVWQANQYSGVTEWRTRVSQLQTGGSSYVPITPERVVDSRSNIGVTGAFTASTPKSFAVAGVGPIPADAIAVTGNVTVTGQTAAGFVSITPTATSTPPSSTLNFPLGDTRANNFTSSLDSAGKLAAVYKAAAGKKAHVIVDITGYFLAGDEDGTYATIEPVRVMDTRPAPEHVGTATVFQHGVTQTLSIADANGIPANATAITGNLTVVGQTHAGFLSVTPDDPVGTPTSSTLNFPLGDVRANGLTADLNDDGDLSITYIGAAGATTHAALDITGYYVEGAGGLLFYPLNPGRVLDSRSGAVLSGISGSFTSGTPKTLEVGSHWGVPAGAEAITGNLTVVGQTAAGFVSITPTPDSSPSTSTLNFPLGDIRANGVTVPLSSDDLSLVYKAAATKKTHLLLDLAGYFR
jgi:uncharacterized membrane protein YoaK (UPF0700 family)